MTSQKDWFSLLQLMYEYRLGDLAHMWTGVLAANRDLFAAEALGKDKADPEYCQNLAVCLEGLAICCENFDADSSLLKQMQTLGQELKSGQADTRCSVLHVRINAVIEGVQDNLESRKFMYLPKDDATYWDNFQLFGDDFATVFPPPAVFELVEMGKCFAASRPIACVFHCMRVAEYGLRILAERLHVKLTDKGKPIPVEYGTWDKVIQAIRNRVTDIRKQPIGPKKEKALQFYSAAADHCEYMKDIWRNEIAHARHRFYTRDETLGVISRVRLFATLIAQHEIPKDKRKHLEQINRRIQELQRSYAAVNPRPHSEIKAALGAEKAAKMKKTED